jgi:hypothetical protein
MLNGPRSVIFAGADHVVLELLISGVADGRAGEDMKTVIMSMTVAVDAEADTRTVIVVGGSVIVFVLVRISIEVVVITSDLGKEGHTDDIWGGDTRESEVVETENGSWGKKSTDSTAVSTGTAITVLVGWVAVSRTRTCEMTVSVTQDIVEGVDAPEELLSDSTGTARAVVPEKLRVKARRRAVKAMVNKKGRWASQNKGKAW